MSDQDHGHPFTGFNPKEGESRHRQEVTRRSFFKQSGILATGVALGIGLGVANSSHSKEIPHAAPPLPWPYAKLDVELARKLGHLGYYKNECSAGAYYGVLWQLLEKVGHPYNMIPIEPPNFMSFGGGGVAGWTTLCGALNGAAAAITTASTNYKPLVDELMGWYADFPFPSDQSNEYASKHQFLVDKYKSDTVLKKSVAKTPLCHESVTNWCLASGCASGCRERSERCARLTGDVAARAVELLNLDAEGKFTPTYQLPAEAAGCRECHFKGKDFDAGQFTRGKMDCLECHTAHDF
jgi:hypothetical protein